MCSSGPGQVPIVGVLTSGVQEALWWLEMARAGVDVI